MHIPVITFYWWSQIISILLQWNNKRSMGHIAHSFLYLSALLVRNNLLKRWQLVNSSPWMGVWLLVYTTIFFLTVPETFYFPTWTVSERWANDERTLNERWTHAEWTVCERRTEFGERYVNGERWSNAERERSTNASAKWTMNARWTQDERSIRKASCVFFSTN